jgi:hypothetical protein
MQFIVLLTTLVSAAAFAPSARMATSSALKMGFESALGAQAPLGFWDPLGKCPFLMLPRSNVRHLSLNTLAFAHLIFGIV